MRRAVIVHCWEGYPEYCWYPWLKNELGKKGFDVSVPAFPDTDNPKQDKWVEFLKKEGIPAPRTCIDCRHEARISQRNKAIFYSRRCVCGGQTSENEMYKNTAAHFHGSSSCPNEFETSYAPKRPEIVYCEACYNAEVV